jgi:hypothetical protein
MPTQEVRVTITRTGFFRIWEPDKMGMSNDLMLHSRYAPVE